MTATAIHHEVTRFATEVRAALADLPADEVDDLTEGLEADLQERVLEDGADALGDPVAYAEELREAAGLPHRGPTVHPSPAAVTWAAVARLAQRTRAALRDAAERYPAVGALGGFLAALRPLWWVVRAIVVFAILRGIVGVWDFRIELGGVLVFLALLVVSVQFGRGRWLPYRWLRGVLRAGDVAIAVAAPFVVALAVSSINSAYQAYQYPMTYYGADQWVGGPQPISGITVDGVAASNLFVYDADGELVRDARIVDQDGTPVLLAPTDALDGGALYADDGSVLLPSFDVPGGSGWNVYPLDAARYDVWDGVDADTPRRDSAPPSETVRPLAGREAPSTDTDVDTDTGTGTDTGAVAPPAVPAPPAP